MADHRMFVNPGSVSIREAEDDSILLYDQTTGPLKQPGLQGSYRPSLQDQSFSTQFAPHDEAGSNGRQQVFQHGRVSYAIVYNEEQQQRGVQHFDISLCHPEMMPNGLRTATY